jgi:23S rRNA pseudouridine1911/1915/1917 synthase
MPFVKKEFFIQEPVHGFVFIMRELGMSQAQAQRLIDRGRLLIDGVPMKDKAAKISGKVELVLFEPQSQGNTPLFAVRNFLVFDKPSGILVHPNKTQSPYTLLDEIRAHSGQHANAVHRIDQETSGLVIASRHKKAETFLKGAFERRDIAKSYLAWVEGKITEDFEVDAPIRVNQDYSQTKHKVFIDFERGKSAKTLFEVIEYDPVRNTTLLRCQPLTGRTHQIRIHLFHVKHPIIGDPIYATTFDVTTAYLEGELTPEDRLKHTGASRLLLHAQTLEFAYGNPFFIESKFDFEGLKGMIYGEREIASYLSSFLTTTIIPTTPTTTTTAINPY